MHDGSNAGLYQRQKEVGCLRTYSLHRPRVTLYGFIAYYCLTTLLEGGYGAQGLRYRYAIQFQDTPDGRYRYELHWMASTFTGAMATCQSRGQGRGILTPLSSIDEIELVSTLLAEGCCSGPQWDDEFFSVGLTTLVNRHSLGFLDRPRPGSSTALLRELAIPGVGYVNGSWPDAPSLATASNAASASAAAGTEDQTNDTLSTPLCATVRVVLLPPPPSPPPLLPPATSDAADAVASLTTGPTLQAVAACDISSAARNLTCSSSRSSNNNNNIGNSSSNNNSKNTTTKTAYQLEVNFQACDEGPTGQGGGNDGAVAHAFVCRVPAPARPSPAPSPSPSPSPPQSAPPPPPPTAKSLTRPASEHPPEHPPPQLPLPGLSNINPKTHTTETAPSEPPLPPLGPGPENTSSSPPARARRRTILAASWGPRGSSHTAGSRRRALSILTGSLGVTTVTLDGTSVTPPPVPLRSEGFPRPAFPPPSPLPPSPSPPLPPPPRGPSPPSPPWGTAESAINTSTALSAELVRPKCDSEVLTVGGVTLRYLACHTAASWAVSAELCADLAPRGTLAAFESQAQLDAVSRAFGAKDLGGMYDFWFGLASGVVSPPEQQPASPSPEGGKPPLEYVLTDPRVVPDFPARLWASGALGVDSTCRAEPDPPEPPGSPPAAPSPGVPLDVAFVQAESPPSASDTAPPRPSSPQSPNLKPTTPIALALPRPSGCCASLTILPAAADPAIAANTTTVTVPGAAAAAAAAGYSTPAPPGDAGPLLLLRACHHKIKFVCQVPVEATGIEVSPGPLGSATGGGATTLIASLFLDAVEPSYKGAYRVFRAQVELRLVGASYSRFSGDGGGALLEDFRNETERQLALATRLPVWSFEVLGLRSGSVVAEVNLTARGLPRATLANFSEFVTASLAVRRPQELFSNDFIQTWTIQDCIVTILALSELSEPPSPASPHRHRNSELLITVVVVVGGSLMIGAALGLLLLVRRIRRRRQRRRGSTPVYLTSLGSFNGDDGDGEHDEGFFLRKDVLSPPQPPQQQQRQQQRSLSNNSLNVSRLSANAAAALVAAKSLPQLPSLRPLAVAGPTRPHLQQPPPLQQISSGSRQLGSGDGGGGSGRGASRRATLSLSGSIGTLPDVGLGMSPTIRGRSSGRIASAHIDLSGMQVASPKVAAAAAAPADGSGSNGLFNDPRIIPNVP